MAANRTRRSRSPEELHRNKRMARTLGCLVASMTAGATLLDWIRPEQTPALSARTELMSEVRDVLGQAGAHGGSQPWYAVHVGPQRPGDALARRRSHFVIGRDGELSRIESSEAGEAIASDGVVRIGLLGSADSNEITQIQWGRAIELVQALQREYAIPGERVHLDDTLVVPIASPTPPVAPAKAMPSSRSRSR